MILETQRLRLAPLRSDDAERLFPIMSDAEVMAHWDVPEIDDLELMQVIVDGQLTAVKAGRAHHWTIRELAGDRLVGACDLSEIDRWHKRGEIGFILGRSKWGQGFASEAVGALVAYGASQGLRKLTARTHLGNRRSDAVLEKLGFKEEGLLRGHVLRDGERRDVRVFGLLL